MAIKIKDTGTLAKKFADRASAAAADYKAGVQDPKRPQNESAQAAAGTWAAAVTEAAGRNAFQKGLQKAGEEKWRTNAMGKGADRFPGGVRAAQGDWAKNVEPFLAALRSLDLPPRGLRRSPQNIQRVTAVDTRLAEVKSSQG